MAHSGAGLARSIADNLTGQIEAGLLKPGDQMPTMRQVAVRLRVDLNTVRHAYDELERLGALTLVRGRGSFVAVPPAPLAPAVIESQTDNLARQTLAAARAQGIDPAALCTRIAALAAAKEENR